MPSYDSSHGADRRRLTRRRLLVSAAGGATLAATTRLGVPTASASRFVDRRVPDGVFALGVASGDPLPDGVVLWTRLAPDPVNGGGMPPRPIAVQWEIATDESMRRVVKRGVEIARPESAHSVHVEVDDLRPDRWYWYRFRVGSQESPIGRTRTMPWYRADVQRLRFAFVSCQDWQNGYYPAYAAIARDELDLVVHLGDYIYEYGPLPGGPRQHEGPEVGSLDSYRNRHALYKTDPALQAAHAAFPWLVTWDDHEVENNYANDISEDFPAVSQVDFLFRRANAYRAYYEHLPLRRSSLPRGPYARLYRRLDVGTLARISLLDTRQYRTDQPCGDGLKPRCAAALDPAATMTGPEQERWLLDGLDRSQAAWNVIAQQTILAQVDFDPRPASDLFNMDQWDGYVAARNRILGYLLHRKPANPVVITGDIHSAWANELKADFADPTSETVGIELVGSSISSDFPAAFIPGVQAALPANPHIRFFDGQYRGYVRCDVTRDRWIADFRAVPTILDPAAEAFTLRTATIEGGTRTLQIA